MNFKGKKLTFIPGYSKGQIKSFYVSKEGRCIHTYGLPPRAHTNTHTYCDSVCLQSTKTDLTKLLDLYNSFASLKAEIVDENSRAI